MGQPLRVSGRVFDTMNAPVAGARVTQWDTANTATTDANGAFELIANVTPQDRSFWVTVEKPGFETSYHWGCVCRRVHVTAPASGTLIAEVSPDRSDVGVTIVSGPVGFPQVLERRIAVAVKAGTEVAIDISTQWDTPAAASFSLSTGLTQ